MPVRICVPRDRRPLEWRVGERNDLTMYTSQMLYLTADGPELEHIREQYRTQGGYSIPMNWRAEKMTWFGDIAKTILVNLEQI